MISIHSSAKKILEKGPLEASAPCRIDSGGTWDIKALALPLERIEPVTVNMALNLRTRVILSPFQQGRVKVTSGGISKGEEYAMDELPFDSPLGLFFSAISYFGFHGLWADISSGSPVKSALGGSSTALVALIKALSKLKRVLENRGLSGREILHLGYHLEDGVSGGNCGIQDQAAAVYGGVNKWTWSYGSRALLKRESLTDREGLEEISNHILVAYSGKSHISARINRSYIEGFLAGRTRSGWIKTNDIVRGLAGAIKGKAWMEAARLLREEMAIRRDITPDALIPITERLINQAEESGCGARFTGAGAGGSVWALGEIERIRKLREVWGTTLSPARGARILDCAVDPLGAR